MHVSFVHVGHERDEALQTRRGRFMNHDGEAPAGVATARFRQVGVGQVQELLAIMLRVDGGYMQDPVRHSVDASAPVWLIRPRQADAIAQAFPPGPKTVVAGWISAIAADLALWCGS